MEPDIEEDDIDDNEEDKSDDEEVGHEDEKQDKKKRKKRFFEYHVRKILKHLSKDKDLTNSSKILLNNIGITTCRLIRKKTIDILNSINKRTITEEELSISIKLLFEGQLSQKCVEEGMKSLKNFLQKIELKGVSRTLKADIIIPPSMISQFLREKDKIYVSDHSTIFFAGVIEYFLSQLIEISILSSSSKNKRITIFDIEKGIQSDMELLSFFSSHHFSFFNSGISSYGKPFFKIKKEREKEPNKDNKKNRKNREHLKNFSFPKSTFDFKFKNYINLVNPDMRYQKECFSYIQDYIEKWLFDVIKYSVIITRMMGKARLSTYEIDIVYSILERKKPKFLEDENENGLDESDSILFENEECGNSENAT